MREAMILGVAVLLTGPAVPAEPPTEQAPGGAAQLVADGAWCWFADPRAIRHKGKRDCTYVGYVTSGGDICVSAFDHDTRTLTAATLHRRLNRDDHANPGLLIRPDGRLWVFYSGHSRRPMYSRISKAPEDISQWEPARKVTCDIPGSNGYCYANPVQLSAEKQRVYLFWRGGNWQPAFATTDDGKTWSAARTFLQAPRGTPPYVKICSDGESRIHIAYTDGHPMHMTANNVYYLCYRDGAFWKADGTKVRDVADLPIKTAEGDRVYDAAKHKARGWIWDIALDGEKPVIVHATIPDVRNHRYRYARWDGTAWRNHELTEAGAYINGPGEQFYSGGVVLDHDDPSVVFCSRQVNGVHELQRFKTADGGKTWTARPITTGSTLKNVRPVVVRGHRGDELIVLWMQGRYDYYTRYRTSLMAWPMKKRKQEGNGP